MVLRTYFSQNGVTILKKSVLAATYGAPNGTLDVNTVVSNDSETDKLYIASKISNYEGDSTTKTLYNITGNTGATLNTIAIYYSFRDKNTLLLKYSIHNYDTDTDSYYIREVNLKDKTMASASEVTVEVFYSLPTFILGKFNDSDDYVNRTYITLVLTGGSVASYVRLKRTVNESSVAMINLYFQTSDGTTSESEYADASTANLYYENDSSAKLMDLIQAVSALIEEDAEIQQTLRKLIKDNFDYFVTR